MTAEEVLARLDTDWVNDALDPAPLESHWRAADNRLTVFRSEAQWVVCFEQVVYNVGANGFERRLWAYGDCLSETETDRLAGTVWTGFPFALDRELAVVDPATGSPVLDRARFGVWINGEPLRFEPTESDFEVAGITFADGRTGPDTLAPELLLRFLCHHLAHPFFASEDILRARIDEWQGYDEPGVFFEDSLAHRLPLFLQTRHWQHPEFDTVPSETEGMRVLARAIASGDLTEWDAQDPALFNSNPQDSRGG
jgi:hypothetical protein